MKNILYRIGGYNPKIVKVGQLGIKFLAPGLSLLIVLITSSWGGYHLADIIFHNFFSNSLFTIVFIFLILLVDFLLLQSPKNGVTAFLRGSLSFSLGTLIAVLTTLSIYSGDIETELTKKVNNDVKTEMNTYDQDIAYSDSLVKVLPQIISENQRLAHREYYQGNPEIGSPKGAGIEYKRYLNNARIDSLNKVRQEEIRDSLKANRNKYEKIKRNKIKKGYSEGLNGQIENLFDIMNQEKISYVLLILIFIALMAMDLVPLSIKWGMMDKLDEDYKNKLNEIKGDSRYYDVELEKFFSENEKEKLKETEKLKRIRAIIEKLENTKMVYAEKKLQYIIDKIKNSNSDSTSPVSNEIKNQDEETKQ